MITVNYAYCRKRDNKVMRGSTSFYNPKKAVRFIYTILSSKDKTYMGFDCDDYEELEEMNILLG